MRLVKAQVIGYQSFSDSGEVRFDSGMNIVIGQNNAGKSALLRALLPTLSDDRHRTPEKWQEFKLAPPKVILTLDVSGEEILEWILRVGGQQQFPVDLPPGDNAEAFVRRLLSLDSLYVEVFRSPTTAFESKYPSHGQFAHTPDSQKKVALITPINGDITVQYLHTESDTLPGVVFAGWQQNMFYFQAERLTIGESSAGYSIRLHQSAENLPIILHTLRNERGDTFQQLVGHLREIFPTVGNLSIRTRPDNNHLEVRVWPTEEMTRVELSFPLNSSGTGVAQVIAILAAIMTIANAVIIIDEINSFLHPAAVKALLRILQTGYSHHQYIISTHAPEVIGFGNPATLHLVRRLGYESSIERLNLQKVSEFREVAEHLGISMADVFAAERVIWVEGPTEELCFPYLHQKLIGPLPRGTIITSVVATGDFNTTKRDAEIVFNIYRRLSGVSAPLVTSVVFSFDTELLTETELNDMKRKANGRLHFLPRRNLECYMLDPAAIAAFVVSKDPSSAGSVTPESIKTALENAAAENPLYVSQWKSNLDDDEWLSHVDGAKLIAYVCSSISEHRAEFNKKKDSMFLIENILSRTPGLLRPLADYIGSLVSSSMTP